MGPFESGNEVDLAVHRPPRNVGNLWAKPDRLSKLIEHLVLDYGRLQIRNEKSLAAPHHRLNENIDLRVIDQTARHRLGPDRLRVVKDEVAGLRRSEPDRLAIDAQGLGDYRDEAGEARSAASAGDQGEHHAHEPASYSRKRIGHKLPPVLVIAGPTASGKSALTLELADALGGPIAS